MTKIAFLTGTNKKVLTGYCIFIFFIVPVVSSTGHVIYLVLRKTIFVKWIPKKELSNNLKRLFQQLFLIKLLEKFFMFLPYILLLFELLNVSFLDRIFLIQIGKNIFFQFGLFLYYKFNFILPFLTGPVNLFRTSELGTNLLNYMKNLALNYINTFFCIQLFIKDTFNDNDPLYILLSLFEIFLNVLMIFVNLFIWAVILFFFLVATRSLSVFLEKLSKKFPDKSLIHVILYPQKIVNALKAATLFIVKKETEDFFSCTTKLKKNRFCFS